MKKNIHSVKEVKIDAAGKTLGRLASEVACALIGKNQRNYRFEGSPNIAVKVENAAKIKIGVQKLESKVYYRHTGYPGGIKSKKLSELYLNQPDQLLRMVVRKMLPKNKQRQNLLKSLSITK